MSETGLHNYLRTHPLEIPRESDRFALLLSDSQGVKLEQVNKDTNFPLKFLCHKCWRSETAVEYAISNIDRLLQQERKPCVLYVFLGTCDITKVTSGSKGYIDQRYKETGKATEKYFNRIKDFVF